MSIPRDPYKYSTGTTPLGYYSLSATAASRNTASPGSATCSMGTTHTGTDTGTASLGLCYASSHSMA